MTSTGIVPRGEPLHSRCDRELGGRRQQHVELDQRHVRAQRRADVQRQGDEDCRRPRHEVRRCRSQRLQKQQNFHNNEEGYLVRFARWSPGSTGNAVGDILTGRIGPTCIRARGRRTASSGCGTSTRSRRTRGSCGRTSRSSTACAAGYWTNNAELNGLGGYFDPSLYDPTRREFLDRATFQRLNGVCYVSSWVRPVRACFDNRGPFAMPRVNMAWDIDGEGNNVLRGGYGMFFNRNMGNVEYDGLCGYPPQRYSDINVRMSYSGSALRRRCRAHLRHRSTRRRLRRGRVRSTSPRVTPDSWKFPKTHSFSVWLTRDASSSTRSSRRATSARGT